MSSFPFNSTKKENLNQQQPLFHVPESQNNDEESSEYVLSELRTNNQISDIPMSKF
jgi:hypothetical protein